MLHTLHWIASITLATLGTIVIIGNWGLLLRWLFDRTHTGSTVPLVGTLFVVVGLLIAPSDSWRIWWWLGLLDVSLWLMIASLLMVMKALMQKGT